MSLLEHPSVPPSAWRHDELEDAFTAWAHDPTRPDVVDLGQHQRVPMVELARLLAESRSTLDASACASIGLPPGVSFATAAAELLHATVDPHGPGRRSFRVACYYLRGLACLAEDREASPSHPRVHSGTAWRWMLTREHQPALAHELDLVGPGRVGQQVEEAALGTLPFDRLHG